MSRRPRALITGFTGMVGSHLADHLLAHTDWDVHGLLRWNDDLANVDHLLGRINEKDRMGLVYGDLNDHPSLQKAVAAVQPDYVFHLAAQSYPKTSFDAPIETLQTNILGTAGLLEAILLRLAHLRLNITCILHSGVVKENQDRTPQLTRVHTGHSRLEPSELGTCR